MGMVSGEASGYRAGYDEGYVEGYQDVPIYRLGEKTIHPEDGNLPVNFLAPQGAYALLYDGYIYYIQDGDIFRMTADGTDPELFIEDGHAEGLCAYNGWLYYSSKKDIIQQNLYTDDGNITYGGTDGHLLVLDSEYYIATEEDVSYFDLSDWSLTPVDTSFVEDYAEKNTPDDVLKSVENLNPVQFSYESRGVVLLDGYDSMLWMGTPEGNMLSRITQNRANDFNLAGEWIFYHNLDDESRLWCVRYDGADDHRI